MDRDNVAGTAAGAFVAILAWVAKQFGHVDVPAEIQVSAALLVSLVVTHFTPRRPYSPEERAAKVDQPAA